MAEGAPGSRAQWDDHWQRYSGATRLNPGQAYRRRLIIASMRAEAGQTGARLLDVGCGSGDLLADLAAAFPNAQLAGVDHSAMGLEVTRRKMPEARLAEARLGEPDFDPGDLAGWADTAVCSEVLEHVTDAPALLRDAAAYLRPGGRLIVTVPGGPMSAFDKQIGHRHHYTPARLKTELTAAGYAQVSARAAGFPMFNVYRLAVICRGARLADDIDGEPSFAAAAAMRLFNVLMPLSLTDTPWGWQITATAVKPG